MVYVGDVAKALVHCLRAAMKGFNLERVIEVGPKEHNTVIQIAQLVKKLTNSDSDIIHLPSRPGEAAGAPVCADTSTMNLIGMSHKDLISLEEGMKLTVD
jgi:nucleoside-diphosphate-sugar epimerase